MNNQIEQLAKNCHAGQFRKGKERLPYIVHPESVVRMLVEWGEPETAPTIAIAWGHDLLEDTSASEEEIRTASNDYVLAGIKFLTCPKGMDKQLYLQNISKNGNRDVLLVKIADRICNSRDFVKLRKEKYAARYFHYADCVFDAICALPPGDRTVENAIRTWNRTSQYLNSLTGYEAVVGCMLGGAVGDALGAPVEFLKLRDIKRRYGESGICGFVEFDDHTGRITDDTQMSLFTAEGLLRANVRQNDKGICHGPSIVKGAYLRWLRTQGGKVPKDTPDFISSSGWLIREKELWEKRAPGITCISALQAGCWDDSIAHNDSKGCGTVMRTAPVGLFFEPELAYTAGCEISAITHGHPTGITAGGAMAMLVSMLRRGKSIERAVDEVIEFLESAKDKSSDRSRDATETIAILKHAKCAETISELGKGWIAEEALAIAIFCALKHPDDFRSGVIEAVNIDGDSDSTGAIAGNLLGAVNGMKGIPKEWVENLRERQIIETIAWDSLIGIETDDDGYATQEWWDKYPGY